MGIADAYQSDNPQAPNYLSPMDPDYLLKMQQAEHGGGIASTVPAPVADIPPPPPPVQAAPPPPPPAALSGQALMDKLSGDLNSGRITVQQYADQVSQANLGNANAGAVTPGFIAPVKEKTMQAAPANGASNPQPVAADKNAAGPPKLYGVGGAGGDASSAPASTPWNIPTARMLTMKPQDIQTGTDIMVKGLPKVGAEFQEASEDARRAALEKNEAEVQEKIGEAGLIRGAGMDREKADAETDKKTEGAHKRWMDAATEDPDHYMSSMSTGKRIGLTVASALMQFGMGLRGQSGQNPILEQMEKEAQRDVAAQKSKADKQHSLYQAAISEGMDAKQAHAVTEKSYLLAGKSALEAARVAANSPTIDAAAKQAHAEIDQKLLDATSRQYGHSQGGAASVGGIPKEVKDLAAKIRLDPRYTGSSEASLAEAARTLGYNYGGPSGAFAAPATAGAGRQAGVQMEYQQNLNRYNAFLSQLDEAEKMVGSGGTIDAARTAKGHTLLHGMAAELGYVNAGKSPNETELATAKDMLPSDLNSYQFTGSDKAKLAQVRKMIEEKKAALMQAGPRVAGGTGFFPGESTADAAAASGATEK